MNPNKNNASSPNKKEKKVEENEKQINNNIINKDIKISQYNLEEKITIPCKNIMKDKIKFQEELVKTNLKIFADNIKPEDINKLKCPSCGKSENINYWVTLFGEIHFKNILNEIVQQKKTKNEKYFYIVFLIQTFKRMRKVRIVK